MNHAIVVEAIKFVGDMLQLIGLIVLTGLVFWRITRRNK